MILAVSDEWISQRHHRATISEGHARIFEVLMRMFAHNTQGLCCAALLLVGSACTTATEPDATLDAVLAQGAASVSGLIDERDTSSVAGTLRVLLPRWEVQCHPCGIQLVVGSPTDSFFHLDVQQAEPTPV